MSNFPEPTAADAEQSFGAALRASALPPILRLVMWTIADLSDHAVDGGQPFALSFEEVAKGSGMSPSHVLRGIADLMEAGWINSTGPDRWLPTVPAPRTEP
jgi:AraC-like DNA-binding protein